MSENIKIPLRQRQRQFVQENILDAAEVLLERDLSGEFSMRQLAEEAGVSFATPFNCFGSKTAIILGLAHRIIGRISENYQSARQPRLAIERLFLMAEIGVSEILSRPYISRPVISALATIDGQDGFVRARSRELWKTAFGDFSGIPRANLQLCDDLIPDQLAISFRGCLSFWVSGEIENDKLLPAVEAAIAIQLLGIVSNADRQRLAKYFPAQGSLLREVAHVR